MYLPVKTTKFDFIYLQNTMAFKFRHAPANGRS